VTSRSTTVQDVARLAGVSIATVSRALRDLPNVSETTRRRVLVAADELRYQPHPHASRLASGRTQTIGIALPLVGQWYFSKVLAGVEAVLTRADYDLLLFGASTPADRRRLLSDSSPIHQRVDGVILVGMHLSRVEVERWASSGLAIVNIGQAIQAFPSVTIDDVGAAALAVRHLVNLGHRRIGLIGGCAVEGVFGAPAERRRGYVAELRRNRLPVRRGLQVEGELTVDGGRDAMDGLLSSPSPPTAVFAVTDELAVGAIDSIRRHGLEVPRHISVVGFDDHDLAAGVGLTTIRQSAVRHGELAAELLLTQIRGEPCADHRDGTKLIVRTSTRPPQEA
jgi:LacI family transcriptional regulator, repressor for deo operon, udp, cdd, tsx, nupC, and nupG